MTKTQHTPLPWAVWKLAPESDQQRRHIITTADGEQEITGIVHHEADAHHIALCVNLHGRFLSALITCANLLADYDESDGEEGQAWREALSVIEEATGSSPAALRKPIVIEVLGGVVQDVLNVPPGYEYEIKDYDDIEADEEAAGRPA